MTAFILSIPDHSHAKAQLNLAEGAGRSTPSDQARFYSIAFGSLKECQAILSLALEENSEAAKTADILGAHLYQLIRSRRGG